MELDDEYFVWSVAFWYLIHGKYIYIYTDKGKGKVHPKTGHEGPEGE
jgi:hypothetical protein